MRDSQKDRQFEYKTSEAPPRSLFSRIVKRLGLEKELALVKQNLKFFSVLFMIFLVLSIFAVIGVRHILAESSFMPFISLAFSDPRAVIEHWHSFTFSLFESMPGLSFALLLVAVAFLMLFARLILFAIDKFSLIIKSINKQKYGHK